MEQLWCWMTQDTAGGRPLGYNLNAMLGSPPYEIFERSYASPACATTTSTATSPLTLSPLAGEPGAIAAGSCVPDDNDDPCFPSTAMVTKRGAS